MCFQIALIVCYWTNWTLMTFENKRRDKKVSENVGGEGVAEAGSKQEHREKIVQGLRDMTDRENQTFRYAP